MKATPEQIEKNKLVNGIWKCALDGGPARVRDYLREKGIPIDCLDGDGATALAIACTRGDCSAVRVLAESGASVNQVPSGKNIPLNNAGLRGHDEILKFLVSAGADVNARFGDNAATVLHNLCQHAPRAETARILLNGGADPNLRDGLGFTPLMVTAWFVRPRQEQDVDIMKVLVDFGADVNARDKQGRSALKIAAVRGHVLQQIYLREAGGVE